MSIEEKCYIDGDYLVFDIEKICGGCGDYEIHLSCADTPEKIDSWVQHLREKRWVTEELLSRFIQLTQPDAGNNREDNGKLRGVN